MAKIEQIKPRAGLWTRIKEMIGRTENDSFWSKIRATFSLFSSDISVDYLKVNYTLTRAIYYASIIKDKRSGKNYGAKFRLGAVFGKPIVNSATSFIIPEPIQVNMEDKNTELAVNKVLKDKHSYIQLAIRNALRDGDGYIQIDEGMVTKLLDADFVDKQVNNLNVDDVKGYEISVYVGEDENSNQKTLYKLVYSKTGLEVRKYNGNSYSIVSGKGKTWDINTPLPIVHFANEPEPNAIYGNSEYQSCYTLMANYHAVLESAVKGDIFNSTPIPFITGISNMKEFKETNGTRQDDGTYKIDWSKQKLLLGGEKTKFGMVQAQDTTKGSETLLNLIFWGICQTSETPEFIMGTAVASSKASTQSQMPVMTAKAQRKQGIFNKPMIELIKLILYRLQQQDSKIKADQDFQIIWPEVAAEDIKDNLEKAKLLSDEGIATKATIGRIAGLDEYVDDIDKEVKDAQAETDNKNQKEASLYQAPNDINQEVDATNNQDNLDNQKITK